jgi:hypothetical protein
VRAVLAVLAAVINAAGPGLCCCVLAGTGVSHHTAAAEKPTATHSCPFCCPEQTDVPKQSEGPKAPKPCGCAERLLVAPVSLPDLPVEAETSFCVESLLDASSGIRAIGLTIVAPLVELPFLPPKDRLRVHHVMHC